MAIIRKCRDKEPKIAKDVFVAENAAIIGEVEIGENSSIWYNTTLRGDVMPIKIGKESNIQDGTVIHGSYEYAATTVGNRVTVGHMVVLHGCEIHDGALIGMGSVIMDKAIIGEHCLVGAGSLVTEGSVFPPRSLIIGRPAKAKRSLTDEEVRGLEERADHYMNITEWY